MGTAMLRVITAVMVTAALVLPSSALAGGSIGGNYSCPKGMEINESAKFCQSPDGTKTAPVIGHAYVIHSSEGSHGRPTIEWIALGVMFVVMVGLIYHFRDHPYFTERGYHSDNVD